MTLKFARLLILTFCLAIVDCSARQDSVFYLVRHAEKLDDSRDPELTDEGRNRARMLAQLLSSAGIEAIFSTDFKRTRDTARPVAALVGREITIYSDVATLATQLRASPSRALVVGHSNTTAQLVELLGGEPGPPINDDEYDRLYIVVLSDGRAETVMLRLPDPEP